VVENPIVAARVEELAILSILVEVDALRLAAAAGHHLAQRRILVREVLTRVGAVALNAALDLRVVETLFRVHVEEERILAQLDHGTPVDALVVAAAALRVEKAEFVHVVGTFGRAVDVHRPVAHLLVRPVLQAWLAQDHLVFARAAEVIRAAVVRVRVEAGRVCWTFQ